MSFKISSFWYHCPSVAVVMCDSNVNAPSGEAVFLEDDGVESFEFDVEA